MGTVVGVEFAMLVDASSRIEALFDTARTRLTAADDAATECRAGWTADASSAYEGFLGFLDASRNGLLGRLAGMGDQIQVTLRDYRIRDEDAAAAITTAAEPHVRA